MRKNYFIVSVLGIGLVLASAPGLMAHHSVSAEFDTTKTITFTGVVKKVEWMNPHIYTAIEVKQPDGQVIVYRLEGGAPNSLFRQGLRQDFVKPGEVVTVTGRPAKNPKSHNVSGTMMTADGKNPMQNRTAAAQ